MQYLTGVHALNLRCELDTCGDWHRSALAWKNLTIRDTENSIFGDYGLEFNKKIPNHEELFTVANHIRALLDLIAEHDFPNAQGMKEDFICDDQYTVEIFNKIMILCDLPGYKEIDEFMQKEYRLEWINFKRGAAYEKH